MSADVDIEYTVKLATISAGVPPLPLVWWRGEERDERN
jgi:hypothetical protein